MDRRESCLQIDRLLVATTLDITYWRSFLKTRSVVSKASSWDAVLVHLFVVGQVSANMDHVVSWGWPISVWSGRLLWYTIVHWVYSRVFWSLSLGTIKTKSPKELNPWQAFKSFTIYVHISAPSHHSAWYSWVDCHSFLPLIFVNIDDALSQLSLTIFPGFVVLEKRVSREVMTP